MIEKIIYDYLLSRGLPVYMQVPEDPPAEYILFEKTGSSRLNHINTATIAIQSYAGSLYQAAVLNETAKRAMDDIITLACIAKTSLTTDYNFTDTSTKKYRYQAVYDVLYYQEEQ